MVEVKK